MFGTRDSGMAEPSCIPVVVVATYADIHSITYQREKVTFTV